MSADVNLAGNPYPDEELSLPEALAELDRREAGAEAAPVPTFTPRQPGASLQQQPPAANPEANVALLQRVADGLQGGQVYISPETARGMLISALWDACRWYGDLSGEDCASCEHGPCAEHEAHQAKAAEYWRLYDVAAAKPGDAALGHVLAAIRGGAAKAEEFTSLGSPLAGILATALAADGGAL